MVLNILLRSHSFLNLDIVRLSLNNPLCSRMIYFTAFDCVQQNWVLENLGNRTCDIEFGSYMSDIIDVKGSYRVFTVWESIIVLFSVVIDFSVKTSNRNLLSANKFIKSLEPLCFFKSCLSMKDISNKYANAIVILQRTECVDFFDLSLVQNSEGN